MSLFSFGTNCQTVFQKWLCTHPTRILSMFFLWLFTVSVPFVARCLFHSLPIINGFVCSRVLGIIWVQILYQICVVLKKILMFVCAVKARGFIGKGCLGGGQEGEGSWENCSATWLTVSGFMGIGLVSGLSLASHSELESFLVAYASLIQGGF